MTAVKARKLRVDDVVRFKVSGFHLQVIRVYDNPYDPRIVMIDGLRNRRELVTVTHLEVR